MIYLALYHGHRGGTGWRMWVARFTDGLTRVLTRGRYSHCEIAIKLPETADGQEYECYSASIRDKGVRRKVMPLPSAKWDLIPVPATAAQEKMVATSMSLPSLIPVRATEAQVRAAFETTRGAKYDWLGATGVIARWRHDKRKWFCSEWCAMALGLPESWRFSPNDLAVIARMGREEK